jgi:hypothetical protein
MSSQGDKLQALMERTYGSEDLTNPLQVARLEEQKKFLRRLEAKSTLKKKFKKKLNRKTAKKPRLPPIQEEDELSPGRQPAIKRKSPSPKSKSVSSSKSKSASSASAASASSASASASRISDLRKSIFSVFGRLTK